MIIATIGMDGQMVPLNQPERRRCRIADCAAAARGGKCMWPRSMMVSGHQINNATTMTVVICMIRSALPLDSWMPLMFSHQK